MIKYRDGEMHRHALRVPPSLGVSIVSVPGFAHADACRELVRLAEEIGFERDVGVTESGKKYLQATVDIEIDKAPSIRNFLLEHGLVQELSKAMIASHGQRPLGFDDVFIVRYRAEEQKDLVRHFDGGDISFMIALSPRADYDGGGTHFDALAIPDSLNILHLEQGDMVLFDALLFHSGVAITRGSRYLLVGFTYTRRDSVKPGHLNLQLSTFSETNGKRKQDNFNTMNTGNLNCQRVNDLARETGEESQTRSRKRSKTRKTN